MFQLEFVSRRPRDSGRCGGQSAGEATQTGTAAASCLRELLVGVRVVTATGAGSVLGHSLGGIARRGGLGKSVATAGGESTAGSRQRVSCALPVYLTTAMDALLGTDFAVAEKDRFYRCLDRVLEIKAGTVSVVAAEVGRSVSCGLRSGGHLTIKMSGHPPFGHR
jgi:hypothetical protein